MTILDGARALHVILNNEGVMCVEMPSCPGGVYDTT